MPDHRTIFAACCLILMAGIPRVEPFSAFSTGHLSLRSQAAGCRVRNLQYSAGVGAMMKLDVAPQVVSAFPTAQEQNQCLAVVNAAVAALNKSDKVCVA
jgi:hypothetical protein